MHRKPYLCNFSVVSKDEEEDKLLGRDEKDGKKAKKVEEDEEDPFKKSKFLPLHTLFPFSFLGVVPLASSFSCVLFVQLYEKAAMKKEVSLRPP